MIPAGCKGVIFDLDGTLYGKFGVPLLLALGDISRLSYLISSQKARKAMKNIDAKTALGWQEIFIEKMGNGEKGKRWYYENFYPRFVGLLRCYRKRVGIEDICRIFKERSIKVGVLSDYAKVEERLLSLKIKPSLFDVLSSCEDKGALKPAVRPFLEIAGEMGLSPSDILVVGDRDDTDGEGARKAGMSFRLIGKKGVSWKKFFEGACVPN